MTPSTPAPPPRRPPDEGEAVVRHQVQRPDYRNDGKYQFIVAYGGGMQTVQCVHLSAAEVAERCAAKLGPGTLIDDGTDLWWEARS